MRLFIEQYKLTISVFIALLFHVSGMLGILISDHSAWFVSNTPLNLWIMFLLLLWNQPSLSAKFWYFFIVAFVTGMLSEIIGVNTGLLFGSYFYGKANFKHRLPFFGIVIPIYKHDMIEPLELKGLPV